MGESLGSMNAKELKNLESKLEKGISRIRSKKVYILLMLSASPFYNLFYKIHDFIYNVLINHAFF